MTYSNLRALVVDDQEVVRVSVCDALRLIGHTVCGTAATGEEAVTLAERLRPDIVVMDIQMHGIGGIEAARRIRALPQPVPVVFLSALDDEEVTEEAAEAGGFGYLVKPFHARQLGPVMRTAIERFNEWAGNRGPLGPAETAREALRRFGTQLHSAEIETATAELLGVLGALLQARGLALCVLPEGSGELCVASKWGEELPDVGKRWAACAVEAHKAAEADPESLGPCSPALLGVPLAAELGADGMLVAFRASAFAAVDTTFLEGCAAGMGEPMASFRVQQPLAWRRWLHARKRV